MAKRSLILALAGLGLLGTEAARALPADREQPIQLSADAGTYDEKSGTMTYRGNVVVIQGHLRIQADLLQITRDAEGNLARATATGKPARFQDLPDEKRGLVQGEAEEVVYEPRDGRVQLTRKAKLKQDTSSFQGASIRYDLNKRQIDAEGDAQNRVQLVFPAQQPAKPKGSGTP